MSLPTILRVFGVVAVLVIAVISGVVLTTGRNGSGAISDGGAALVGGKFTLVDQYGKTRTEADFRGKLMLVYFGYTYCPDFCPTELNTITDALHLLGADATKVQPIFITVDPARDTVEQMRLYAQSFDPRLVALTGTPEQIAVAAKAYRVYYAKSPGAKGGDYFMDHSTFIYLMGRDGAYLTHFRYGTTAQEMAAGIRKYF